MSIQILAFATPLWLAVGAAPAQQVKPAPDVLRRPGERTILSFVTSSGKTASVCEGPKAAYLVYRFGTAAKTELQYPAVLDSSSWRKFTYWPYHRPGGVANAGMENYELSFKNGGAQYTLVDHTEAYLMKGGEENYRRTVSFNVVLNGKALDITVRQASVNGDLYLNEEQRDRVKLQWDE
ncbi:hypothetical protein [Hymenobacter sp. DG01]|uniref:hypothetical protein n=1 Tax=Hymenobacter sp. DG01 TaxID=2584940 RepID=UPI0011219A83|nr:hypothetical protein [Hymenobacter sp. DG01]